MFKNCLLICKEAHNKDIMLSEFRLEIIKLLKSRQIKCFILFPQKLSNTWHDCLWELKDLKNKYFFTIKIIKAPSITEWEYANFLLAHKEISLVFLAPDVFCMKLSYTERVKRAIELCECVIRV